MGRSCDEQGREQGNVGSEGCEVVGRSCDEQG